MDNEPVGQEPTIDLVREEMRELASSVIDGAGNPTEPFGVYVFTADEPAAELARYVERTVFEEAFGNPRELLEAEYGPYESSTVFYAVLDHRRRLPVDDAHDPAVGSRVEDLSGAQRVLGCRCGRRHRCDWG